MADAKPKKVQIHVIVSCSDSRDIPKSHNEAMSELVEEYREKGTLVEVARLAAPGSHITPEIKGEIKSIVFHGMNRYMDEYGIQPDTYIHVASHGNATLKPGADAKKFSYHEIQIEPNCPTNCGMTHAREAAKKLEEVMLLEKPVFKYGKYKMRIASEEQLENFMKMVHNHDGTIAGSWVRSIDDIPTHAYTQKKILRETIVSDTALKHMGIKLTAGVQNYHENYYFRVDANKQNHTFFDETFERARKKDAKTGGSEDRTAAQNPKYGLFHQSDIHNARENAITLLDGSAYSAGQVFAIGGKNLADYFRLFGPYKVTGFFYGVANLGLKEWGVLCKSPEDAFKATLRLSQDPIMGFIIRTYDVKIVPMTPSGLLDYKTAFSHMPKKFMENGMHKLGAAVR
ncbi:MAG: hypothetical protein M1530_01005 [Candidatus Marsarchaeota archaeon]|nr:hypothetical protein [Candidatus Marsarchaeota archaeon]